MKKPFLLPGSYKTYLSLAKMQKEAKKYWKKEDIRRKREYVARWKMLLRLWIITEKDLMVY
jgi:hypothetical protein